MAYDSTTSSGLTVEVKQFYDMVLLERALPNLVHLQFGQKRDIPRNAGKSIEFRRFNSLPESTTPLTEGTAPTALNISVSNVVASINQFGAVVQFTDQLVETAIDPYLSEAAYLLGEHAGSSIDIITRNIMTSGTNIRYAQGVASRGAITASTIVNSSELRKVMRTLKRANARGFPELDGKFFGITHPDVESDLLSDSTITTLFQRAAPPGFDDQPELLGYVGEYMNIALFETTNARIYSSQGMSGADVYASLFGGKDAYGISEIDSMGLKTYYQPLGSSGAVNDPLGQVGSIGWKCYHAAAILNQGWLVRLESGATP